MNLIQVTDHGDHLQLSVEPFPLWEQFIDWANPWLSACELAPPLDVSQGADRHMVVFTFNQTRFSLNYENYSQSIWIEPQEPSAAAIIEQLALKLQQPNS